MYNILIGIPERKRMTTDDDYPPSKKGAIVN